MNSRPIPSLRRGLLPLLAILSCVLGACVSAPQRGEATAEPRAPAPAPAPIDEAAVALEAGLRHYEGGRYEAAAADLRRALAGGLKTPADAALAHKHLAFMLCAGGQRARCKDEFRQAFRIDPAFALARAEAGHPMWGPVFAEVRKERAGGSR